MRKIPKHRRTVHGPAVTAHLQSTGFFHGIDEFGQVLQAKSRVFSISRGYVT